MIIKHRLVHEFLCGLKDWLRSSRLFPSNEFTDFYIKHLTFFLLNIFILQDHTRKSSPCIHYIDAVFYFLFFTACYEVSYIKRPKAQSLDLENENRHKTLISLKSNKKRLLFVFFLLSQNVFLIKTALNINYIKFPALDYRAIKK